MWERTIEIYKSWKLKCIVWKFKSSICFQIVSFFLCELYFSYDHLKTIYHQQVNSKEIEGPFTKWALFDAIVHIFKSP